jgi:two-component system, NarL family, nitrate/nitrite response regulator NarL
VKVLVVDAQRMVADGLVHVLSEQADFVAVRAAHSVEETRSVVRSFAPNVVVVDWALPAGDGASAVEVVRATCSEAHVLVLADLADAGAVTAALSAGCDGFVTRDLGLDELVAAVASVGRGEAVLSPAAAAVLARDHRDRDTAPLLSARELQIVAGLARGLTNRAIAEELYLSVHTVRNHIQRICRRLGASSRLEVVVIAARSGLVDLAAGA